MERDKLDQLVAQVKEQQQTNLDLADCGLTDADLAHLLSDVERLASVRSLNLSRNGALTDAGVGQVAQRLTKLTSLDLGGCLWLTDAAVAEVARGLTNLTYLHLGGCWLLTEAAVAEVARGLPNLTSLDLGGCLWLTEAGVAEVARGLTNLTSLHLSGCVLLTDAAVAEVARGLTNLTSLDLGGCSKVTRLPEAIGQLTGLERLGLAGTALVALPQALEGLTRLTYLGLPGNPALGLPAELLSDPRNPKAILDYYFRGTREGRRQLNEAKLVVVGNEAVGKTSLVNFLVSGRPCRPDEAKTQGVQILERINIDRWNLPRPSPGVRPVLLNVWDFGGQEVLHQTHRFFLTERSLYLLVLEARRENAADNDGLVHDWMRTILNRAGAAPVVVVVNKSEPPHELRLDERSLRREYPNLRGFVRTSCLDPQNSPAGGTGIQELRGLIEGVVREDLPHVRDWFPTSYFAVKDHLGEQAREESVLDSHAYRTLCEREGIPKEEEQRNLLKLLDAIGVVVAYDETTLLDPNWLTCAVYRLLTHADVAKANGEFAFNDLGALLTGLPPEKYPPGRWRFVIDMMRRFGLCFELRDCQPDRYLIPEQLPPNEPDLNIDEAASLRFRFDYEALPHGLVPSFIVQAHDLLSARPTVWANGALLETNGCKVLVRGDRKRRQVHIFVAGNKGQRRSALAVIRDRFAVVHRRNKELNPKEMVPLPDNPDVAATYGWLVQLENMGESSCFPDGATRKYSLADLLSGVDEGGRRRTEAEEEGPGRGGDQYNTYNISAGVMSGVAAGQQNAARVGDVEVSAPAARPAKPARAKGPSKPRSTTNQTGRTRKMSTKKDPEPRGHTVTSQGPMVGVAVGEKNRVEVGDVTVYEQNLRQSQHAVPPELLTALVEALKGIQESGLPEAVKKEAVADHAKLTEELKKPEPHQEPALLKKFWAGLWAVADKVPAVVKLYEALKGVVPGLG
jgi:internalin A